MTPPSDHFKGKSFIEHLKEARARGGTASAEIHGTELPGHIAAGTDAAKEMSVALIILWISLSYFFSFHKLWICLVLFSCGWILWKTARSALLGWARIERLHRVIEQERWEIEHHRTQEREELTAMYEAKGLSGKLLEEVIDVLMADDNRLLHVMLEEELGLTLEAYEHPLKQALGALCGTLISASMCLFGLWIFPPLGLCIFAAFIIIIATTISAKFERNLALTSVIWNLAILILVTGAVYFLIPLIV